MQVTSPHKKQQLFLFDKAGAQPTGTDSESAGPRDTVAPFTLEQDSANTGVLSLAEAQTMFKNASGGANETGMVGRHEFETLMSMATKSDPSAPPMGYKRNPHAGSPHEPRFIRDTERPDINAIFRGYC